MQVKQPLPNPKKFAILQTTSNLIIGKLERFFFRWGIWVATNPALVIVSSLLVASLSAVGFLNFSSESRAEKLWIPSDSPYIANKAWLDQNYPQTRRQHFALFVSETNILTPEALMEMFRVHQKVHAIKVSNKTYADLCFKLPIANIFLTKKRRRKRQALGPRNSSPSNPNDPSVVVPSEVLNATLQIENATGLNTVNATRDQRFLLDSDSPEPEKQESSQTNQDETEEDEESNSLWSGYDLDEEYEDIYEDYDFENEDYEIDFVEKDEIEDSKNGDGNGDGQSDDPQDSLSPEIYCDLVSTLDQKCLENSLLEIWRYSESRIQRLTQNDILYAVNQVAESPWFGYRTDFAVYLGAVERNSTGHIVSAKSAIYSWAASFDPDGELTDEGGVGVELDLADKLSLDFEKEMISSLLESSKEAEERSGVKIYVNVARSFNDITAEAIFFDAVKMAAGYFLMFFYTMFFLGRINLVEHRTWIAAGGIFSVAMGLGIAFGITSAIGLPYTPIHGILPFLALGIGIDDMFVIVQCWYNLSPEEQKRGLKEKIGLTMQHAGVAITVTSLTDVFAFGVGAVTILPGLQTFCVTCAIAIASIYILQASWFAALLSLDERRIRARRDGLAPCIKYRNWTPMAWSQKDMGRMFMGRVAKLLSQGVVKALVILLTLGFCGTGIYGTYLIRQEFDPVLLLPAQSYLRQWLAVQGEHFPSSGWDANIYTGPLNDLENDLEQMDQLASELQSLVKEGRILRDFNSWWVPFRDYIETKKNVTDWHTMVRDGKFEMFLSDFLFSKVGSRFKPKIIFEKEIVCNEPTSKIKATKSDITFVKFSGPEEHVPGRRLIENLIQTKKFSSKAFSFSKVYAAWETDEVISFELWRNLALAMVCVFIITLVLLANVKICLMVLSCVCLTLVDMVGVLHFWGLTIDTISCINIVLAIGLCVDYSAHIAHAFIVEEGDRQTRATNSLVSMGPAILNGGITTFLALVLLGFSESHAFITFFKVFLLTVVFGLFHGLVYLPVVLSIMGPLTSHDDSDTDSNSGSSSVMTDSTNGNFKDQQPMNTSGLINDGYVHDEFRLFGGNDIMGPGPLRGHRGGHFIKNELSLSRSPSGPWFAPHAKRKSKTKRFVMGRGESQGKLQINTLDENVSLGSLYGMFPSAGVNGQYNAYGSIAPSANRVFQSRPYQSRNAPILSDWDQMRERERDEPELSNQYEPFYVRNNGSSAGSHANFHAYRPSLIGAPEDKEALWSKARYKAGGGPSIGPSERSRASSKQSNNWILLPASPGSRSQDQSFRREEPRLLDSSTSFQDWRDRHGRDSSGHPSREPSQPYLSGRQRGQQRGGPEDGRGDVRSRSTGLYSDYRFTHVI